MLKNRILLLCLLLMMVFSFAACSKEDVANTDVQNIEETAVASETVSSSATVYPLTFVDSFDREVVIESEPMKIVSIAPSVTETVYAIGAGDKLVARTDYCDYPAEALDVSSIGSLSEPNIESIAALEPDLIIASTHFKEETLAKLEELGLKVVVLVAQDSFESVYDVIGNTGLLINKNDEAAALVDDMNKKVSKVSKIVEGSERPTVYYVVGFGEYGDYTATGETFISQMITMAGGENIAKDATGWSFSLESIVAGNPDYVICKNTGDTKATLEKTNGYMDLDAVKNGRLMEIDSNMIDRMGPRLADGLYELAKIIHPERFN